MNKHKDTMESSEPANLPSREQIEPILEITSELDKSIIESNSTSNYQKPKILKKYSANFNGSLQSNSLERRDGKNHKKSMKTLLLEKDEYIAKIVERLNVLNTINNLISEENSKYRKKISIFEETIRNLRKNLENIKCLKCQKILMFNNNADVKEKCEMIQKSNPEIDLNVQPHKDIEENENLKNDIKMMKTLVHRLNIQLERYQTTLRNSINMEQQQQPFDPHLMNLGKINKPMNWGDVQTHTLGPLLNTYEELIAEKTDLIQQYESELNEFTGRIHGVIEENENLHQEVGELQKQNTSWSSEKARLNAQLDVCRNKLEIHTKRADLAKDKLIDVIRCYEQKLQVQSIDLERLQEAYNRTKTELQTYRIQDKPEIVNDSLKECQRLFEELRQQYDNDKTKLVTECQKLNEVSKEFEIKLREVNERNVHLNLIINKQKENNDILNDRNSILCHKLVRLRQSRDTLINRYKAVMANNKIKERKQQKLKSTLKDVNECELELRHRESQILKMHLEHTKEMEKLTRKLHQREDTLKKILESKTKIVK